MKRTMVLGLLLLHPEDRTMQKRRRTEAAVVVEVECEAGTIVAAVAVDGMEERRRVSKRRRKRHWAKVGKRTERKEMVGRGIA